MAKDKQLTMELPPRIVDDRVKFQSHLKFEIRALKGCIIEKEKVGENADFEKGLLKSYEHYLLRGSEHHNKQ